MKRLSVYFIPILFLSGCVTDGVKFRSDKYYVFFTPGDHIEELMKEPKCEEAAQIYDNET